jgi:hypothetical protein
MVKAHSALPVMAHTKTTVVRVATSLQESDFITERKCDSEFMKDVFSNNFIHLLSAKYHQSLNFI